MAQVRLSPLGICSIATARGCGSGKRAARVRHSLTKGHARMSDSGSLLHEVELARECKHYAALRTGKIASPHEFGGGVRLRDSRPHRCARLGGSN